MAIMPAYNNPGRPGHPPGLSRDTARSTPIDPSMIARAIGGLKTFLGVGGQGVPGSIGVPFFPPGKPMDPVAPGAAGRRFDYPSAYNLNIRPRTYEAISFDTLRAISDPTVGGWALIRLAIETRKDQVSQLIWSVLPRKQAGEKMRPKSDSRSEKIEELLRVPDGVLPWQQWCGQLVEEHLVIDAPAIRRVQSIGGDTIGLELIDGATIVPKLNYDGRRPNEGPAYQQILKGFAAVDYTKDELLYVPRNSRVHKVYGFSCVEQIVTTVNIGLRREAGQLAYFTDGTVPDAIAQLPATFTTAQIAEFQAYWDGMVNDAITRRKMKFVPGGVAMQLTRQANALVDEFDEWLARIVAYCFSLPPTPFVKMQNRATAESAYETALNEGLQPLMIWLKGVVDYIIANWLGAPDLEMVWDEIKKADPAEKEQRDLMKVQQGIISRDDMRADIGMEPLGIGPIVQGLGPLGFMSIDAMKKAIANGWDLTGMPAAPAGPGGDLGALGGPGGVDSADGGAGGGDLFAGLPPEILEALGVPPPGKDQLALPPPAQTNSGAPAGMPALAAPPDSNPHAASNVVPIHQRPDVQATFRDGHKAATQFARRMGKRHA